MTTSHNLLLFAALGSVLNPWVMLQAESPGEHLAQRLNALVQHPTDAVLRNRIKSMLQGLPEPSDTELLGATPIPRVRMELIWVEPPKLRDLAAKVKAAGGSVTGAFYDSADKDYREFLIREEDVLWAQNIEKLVDFAYEAGLAGRFEESVHFYKLALLLAPGGDLFLMSIGVAYVQLGEKTRGLRFLKLAAQLSPNNGRIRRNLQAAVEQ